MNRRELVGHFAEELGRVFPNGDEALECEDLDTVETVTEQVLSDARDAITDEDEAPKTE